MSITDCPFCPKYPLRLYMWYPADSLLCNSVLKDIVHSNVYYCDVFIRLSFWRHPFTAEHPLLRHILQTWWRNNSSWSQMNWGWERFQLILLFVRTIPLIAVAWTDHVDVKRHCMVERSHFFTAVCQDIYGDLPHLYSRVHALVLPGEPGSCTGFARRVGFMHWFCRRAGFTHWFCPESRVHALVLPGEPGSRTCFARRVGFTHWFCPESRVHALVLPGESGSRTGFARRAGFMHLFCPESRVHALVLPGESGSCTCFARRAGFMHLFCPESRVHALVLPGESGSRTGFARRAGFTHLFCPESRGSCTGFARRAGFMHWFCPEPGSCTGFARRAGFTHLFCPESRVHALVLPGESGSCTGFARRAGFMHLFCPEMLMCLPLSGVTLVSPSVCQKAFSMCSRFIRIIDLNVIAAGHHRDIK